MVDHTFVPETYHLSIGSHEPVLFVESGDRLITKTADAGGRDFKDEVVSGRGNPQTGPIHVNGSMPGDVLAVKFEKIVPNRNYGFCRPKIAANVLDPGHPSSLSSEDIFHFNIDLQAGTATIDDNSGYGGSLIVPLRPMIGCFGVAPDRGQSISTATSGPYGGNMDYLGFCEGTTAYLPVFVEGALFHIGDGHAWQSDGEILGTGIEISMDLEFTLTTLKGNTISWPRGENEKYIFTAGNARPLDEALQHATSEMLYWLQDTYGMREKDANILLGTFVKYDVGNVFDPAYTMICKIPKEVLPSESKSFLI
jgi:amidase